MVKGHSFLVFLRMCDDHLAFRYLNFVIFVFLWGGGCSQTRHPKGQRKRFEAPNVAVDSSTYYVHLLNDFHKLRFWEATNCTVLHVLSNCLEYGKPQD